MNSNNNELIDYLYQFMLPERANAFKQALSNRTRYVSILLEDLFQHQNYSAVIRSVECFGIQDLHVIENRNKFNLNPDVVMGANKWLTIHQHQITPTNTLQETVKAIKAKGYRLIATTPNPDATPISDLNLTQSPLCIAFGTELTGISPELLAMADEQITIPMYGLTASLNISVSAAITLQNITSRIRHEVPFWQLTSTEREQIELEWLTKSLKRADLLKNRYISSSK